MLFFLVTHWFITLISNISLNNVNIVIKQIVKCLSTSSLTKEGNYVYFRIVNSYVCNCANFLVYLSRNVTY